MCTFRHTQRDTLAQHHHTVQSMTMGWNYQVKRYKADNDCEIFAPGGTQDIHCRSITQAWIPAPPTLIITSNTACRFYKAYMNILYIFL